MATIRFKLRKECADKNGDCPIVLVYQNGRKETILSTGKKTNAKYFEVGTNTPIVKTNTDHKQMNIILRSQFNKLVALKDGYLMQHNNEPSNDWIKHQWNAKDKPSENFFDLFDRFIVAQQLKGSKSVSDGTVANYRKVKTKLKMFQQFTSKPIFIEDINENFAWQYNQYLTTEHNYISNSIGEHLKIIKTFLLWCERESISINKNALQALKGSNDKSWALYLSFDELKALSLFKTNFSDTKDACLLQSCLGVRHSDLKTVIKTKIIKEGADYFYITNTKKTNKLIKVKLIDLATAILDRRSAEVGWIPSIGDMNRNLKLLFKEFGFTEMIQMSKGSGNSKREYILPKYELVSTHTFRRTFINLMRKLKIDDSTISAITGQSLAVLSGYYQPSDFDVMEAMDMLNKAVSID